MQKSKKRKKRINKTGGKIKMRRKRKIKSCKDNLIKKSVLKIAILLLIIGLNWTGLLAVGRTLAYFNDSENSSENTYSAGALDFSLTNPNFSEFIGLTEKLSFGSVLTNSGSLGFQYTVESEKISGSDDFCDALELEVELNGIEKHDGNLMSFSLPALTTLGSWSFEVKLPVTATNISHGETCEVDFVFKGWQTDMATYENGGFSDEERFHLNLTSRMVVLNEFLPNPNGLVPDYGFDFGDDSSTKPQGEWVELYNNSDTSYDLDGWYIWDASGDDLNKVFITNLNTLPANTVISGRSWLVVYMNKAVLDNTGDTVKLFDNTDTLIDSYTYTTDNDYCYIEPTPEDENATTTTGSCGGVPPNKSYARIPDGIGYWVDPIPTPGLPNVLDSSANNDYSWLNELPVESSEVQPQVQPEEEPEEPLGEDIDEGIEEASTSSEELIEEGQEATTTEETTEEATTTEEEIPLEETPEEGTTTEEEVVDEITEDDPVENAVTTEEVIDNEPLPAEEENPIEEEPIQETEEIIEEEIVEEIIIEEAPQEEIQPEESPPAIEEEPVIIPDDTPPQDENPESNNDSGESNNSGDTEQII